jgi:hypothetical protein
MLLLLVVALLTVVVGLAGVDRPAAAVAASPIVDGSRNAGGLTLASDVVPTAASTTQPKATSMPAGGMVKTLWHDAKVGDTLVYKMSAGVQQTSKVTKVGDDLVIVEVATSMSGKVISTMNNDYPRMIKAMPVDTVESSPDVENKELAPETLKISGQDIKCKVIQTTMKFGGKTTTSKTWTSDQVPGGMVKSESDMTGANAVMLELIEFKKGS